MGRWEDGMRRRWEDGRIRNREEKIEVVDKFVSKTDEGNAKRKKTYEESIGWYNGITTDMFS